MSREAETQGAQRALDHRVLGSPASDLVGGTEQKSRQGTKDRNQGPPKGYCHLPLLPQITKPSGMPAQKRLFPN
jgi:hypothetical protein